MPGLSTLTLTLPSPGPWAGLLAHQWNGWWERVRNNWPTVKRVMVNRSSLTFSSVTPRVSALRSLRPVVRRVPVCRTVEGSGVPRDAYPGIYQDVHTHHGTRVVYPACLPLSPHARKALCASCIPLYTHREAYTQGGTSLYTQGGIHLGYTGRYTPRVHREGYPP